MRIPDKLYDILKWVCLIVIPALSTFYAVLADALGFPYADIVAKIAAGVCTLIGTLIGISNYGYQKELESIDSDNE